MFLILQENCAGAIKYIKRFSLASVITKDVLL